MVDNDDGDEDNDDDKDIDSDMVEVTHEDNETAKDELSVSQLEFFSLLDYIRMYLTDMWKFRYQMFVLLKLTVLCKLNDMRN